MAEFTGERVIPGQVDADLLNEHLARYAFAARLSKGKHVLDAGCGAGYGSAELARDAAEVLGIDCSADALAYAREHYAAPNLRFDQGDCESLPAADGSLDLVVAFEVIEHLENWRAFLAEVRRVLAPDGQFIVSTPNKLYYSESRKQAGANPFHVHEFEYDEFRAELSGIFPHVAMYLENHAESVVFQPVERDSTSEARVEGQCAPDESHFFVAVCALFPRADLPAFVYVPRAANVLRERERHIELLEQELADKNRWLESAKNELAELNAAHQDVLAMFRRQTADLDQSNRWAEGLNRDLEQRGARILELQSELCTTTEAYENKVAELERENQLKTQWALDTEAEFEARSRELARCVELLDTAERTVTERTLWAQRLQAESEELERQLSLVKGSRWIKLGRKLGLGPVLENGR